MVSFTIGAIWLSRSAPSVSGRGTRFPKRLYSASLGHLASVRPSHPAESPCGEGARSSSSSSSNSSGMSTNSG